MKLIDRIVTEIFGRNLLGEYKYISLNKESFKELESDFQYEFGQDYEDFGKVPVKEDIEEYLKMKIIIDDSVDGDKKYELLTKVRSGVKKNSTGLRDYKGRAL